jgi:DNA-binding FrmR family transcriptional regulator
MTPATTTSTLGYSRRAAEPQQPAEAPDAAVEPAVAEPAPRPARRGATPDLPRGYSATKDQLLRRLARIEGQVRGLQRMVEQDRYCIDIITQISAVQAALDKVALGLLDDHARSCVLGAAEDDRGPRTDELMGAVGRLMRRS